MITRDVEVCPKCGQHDPWRKYSSRTVHGQRRIYVKCKRCGAREVIVYRLRTA
jgi:DNA-directed RNA polymerase subunit M/transcription elongation factor TFIIS